MDKTQRYFTQSIVGGAQRYVLGQQVRFDRDPELGGTTLAQSVAQEMSGIQSTVLEKFYSFWSMVTSRAAKKTVIPYELTEKPSITKEPKKIRMVINAALGTVLVAIILQMAITWFDEYKNQPVANVDKAEPTQTEVTAKTSEGLPLAASGAVQGSIPLPSSEGVTIINAQANDEATETSNPSETTKGNLQVESQQTPKVIAPVPPQILEQPKNAPIKLTQSVAREDQPTLQRKAKDEEIKSALVLDVHKPTMEEVAPTKKPAASASANEDKPAPAQPLQRAAAPSTEKVPQSKDAPTVLAQPVELNSPPSKKVASRVTVVDLATDGSYALITNPETRLPQKFKVGEKIHTGEMIQKIEPKTGKLILESRTIYME